MTSSLPTEVPEVAGMPWEVFVDRLGRVLPRDRGELEAFEAWWAGDFTEAGLLALFKRFAWAPPWTGYGLRPSLPEEPPKAFPFVPRGRRFPHLVTLNCGLGRDSIAMLCLLRERKLLVEGQLVGPEDIDAVVFSDTGAEWPHTYALLPRVRLFCAEMGVRFLHLRKPPVHGWRGWADNPKAKGDRSDPAWVEGTELWSIERKAFEGAYHRRIPIREEYEQHGKIAVTVSASCTDNHKVQPIRRMRSDLCEQVFGLSARTWSARVRGKANQGHGPDAPWQRHRVLLGIAADEASRAVYTLEPYYEWPVYPLLEAGIAKADEAAILQAHGFDTAWMPVFKSGCFMCPYQPIGWYEVLRQLHPQLFARVEAYEAAALARNAKMFVVGGKPLVEAVDGWVERHPEQALDREGVLRKAYHRGLKVGAARTTPQGDLFCGFDSGGGEGWVLVMPPEERRAAA